MFAPRKRIRSQARPALLWTLGFFLAGQLILGVCVVYHYPELCDPEFNTRLRDLRARMSEAPERPLALALGSSRVAFGLRPASVKAEMAEDQAVPILFNFALLGAGPVGERLILHRLLKKDIKPKWVFLEVWPPFFPQAGFSNEEDILFRRDLYWSDVAALSRLYHRRGEVIGRVFAETVTPFLHHRLDVLKRCAPCLLPPFLLADSKINVFLYSHLDGFGWAPFHLDAAEANEIDEHTRRAQLLTKPLFDKFCVNAISDKALKDMLEECRTNDVRVAFLLMPEHSLLRSWYPPMQGKLTAYLRRLSKQYHAPVFDARAWCGDEDIPDCCHLSPCGARTFSARFGREIYRPFVKKQPMDKTLLLRGSWDETAAFDLALSMP